MITRIQSLRTRGYMNRQSHSIARTLANATLGLSLASSARTSFICAHCGAHDAAKWTVTSPLHRPACASQHGPTQTGTCTWLLEARKVLKGQPAGEEGVKFLHSRYIDKHRHVRTTSLQRVFLPSSSAECRPFPLSTAKMSADVEDEDDDEVGRIE